MANMSNQMRVVKFLQSKTGQKHLASGKEGNKAIVNWIEENILGRDGEAISRANAHSYFQNAYNAYVEIDETEFRQAAKSEKQALHA